MNLQLTVPYVPCIYRCPFCIASKREHENKFERELGIVYLGKLANAIRENNITTIVITGECDPSQQIDWVSGVAYFIKADFPHVKIEVQTAKPNVFLESEVMNYIDVLGASLYTVNGLFALEKMLTINPTNKIVRPTVILNRLFNIGALLPEDVTIYKQMTFKHMQLSADDSVNEWIKNNQFKDYGMLNDFVKRYESKVSIFVDTNCQKAEGRYLIYRPDGNLYANWGDTTPLTEKGGM